MQTTRDAAPAAPPTEPKRPPSWRTALATTFVPLATAGTIVAVMAGAWSRPENGGDVAVSAAFVAWNLLPVLGSVAVLLWAGRLGWLPYAAATVGAVTLAAVTVWSLHDFTTSASSTAALMFVFLPLMQWTVVFVAAGLVLLAWWWDRRRSRNVVTT
jgi:hypothetical protein